jgi:hypothetical protein
MENRSSRAFDVITLYSQAHDVLYRQFFRASFPHPAWIVAERLELGGNAEYLSSEWQEAMAVKPAMIARHLRKSPEGFTVVYSDTDIQFLPGFSANGLVKIFDDAGKDILFQKESSRPGNEELNGGFCMMRASPRLAEFFERVAAEMQTAAVRNDQPVINELLPRSEIAWGTLPLTFYARSHGFPPPRDAWIHHANTTLRNSTRAKIRGLERVRRMFHGGPVGWYRGIFEECLEYAGSGKLWNKITRACGRHDDDASPSVTER